MDSKDIKFDFKCKYYSFQINSEEECCEDGKKIIVFVLFRKSVQNRFSKLIKIPIKHYNNNFKQNMSSLFKKLTIIFLLLFLYIHACELNYFLISYYRVGRTSLIESKAGD